MRLPAHLRAKLKEPLGHLIADSDLTRDLILSETRSISPVTVGDATFERMVRLGISPRVHIIDGYERRQKRAVPAPPPTVLRCKNPPGQITDESVDAVRQALKAAPPVRLEVDGEEDLLVIPVCIYAPDGTPVLYGQPGEGLVILRVDSSLRNKTKLLLDMME